ncbi:hypothetical protein DRO58_04930, partial [Candidatus Bathyarchaeota archaeon]
MGDWRDWSDGWLREGYFISYVLGGVRYYEHIVARDLAHYVYTWHEVVGADETSGPRVPSYLVMTKGYDRETNTNRVWQLIFGIEGQAY